MREVFCCYYAHTNIRPTNPTWLLLDSTSMKSLPTTKTILYFKFWIKGNSIGIAKKLNIIFFEIIEYHRDHPHVTDIQRKISSISDIQRKISQISKCNDDLEIERIKLENFQSWKRILLLLIAITTQNIPEGKRVLFRNLSNRQLGLKISSRW